MYNCSISVVICQCSNEKCLPYTCLNSVVSLCAASELQSFIPHSPILTFILSSSLSYSYLLSTFDHCSHQTKRLLTPKELPGYTTPSLSALTSHATIGVLVHMGNPSHQASLEGIHLPALRIIYSIQTLVEGHCVLYEVILCLLLY